VSLSTPAPGLDIESSPKRNLGVATLTRSFVVFCPQFNLSAGRDGSESIIPTSTKRHAFLSLIFAGFMLFNFMTNLGPNAQTYLLTGEVFPTAIRGKGAGFAAAVGKIGAVTTAFLFPILLASIGTTALLYILVWELSQAQIQKIK
jgi:nitrate/nitrite transporter NarK